MTGTFCVLVAGGLVCVLQGFLSGFVANMENRGESGDARSDVSGEEEHHEDSGQGHGDPDGQPRGSSTNDQEVFVNFGREGRPWTGGVAGGEETPSGQDETRPMTRDEKDFSALLQQIADTTRGVVADREAKFTWAMARMEEMRRRLSGSKTRDEEFREQLERMERMVAEHAGEGKIRGTEKTRQSVTPPPLGTGSRQQLYDTRPDQPPVQPMGGAFSGLDAFNFGHEFGQQLRTPVAPPYEFGQHWQGAVPVPHRDQDQDAWMGRHSPLAYGPVGGPMQPHVTFNQPQAPPPRFSWGTACNNMENKPGWAGYDGGMDPSLYFRAGQQEFNAGFPYSNLPGGGQHYASTPVWTAASGLGKALPEGGVPGYQQQESTGVGQKGPPPYRPDFSGAAPFAPMSQPGPAAFAGTRQDYRPTVTIDDTLNRRVVPVLDNQQSTVTLEHWLTYVEGEIRYRSLLHPRAQILFALRHLDQKIADTLTLQNVQEGDWAAFVDTLKILVKGAYEPSKSGLSLWVGLVRWRHQDCEEFLNWPPFVTAWTQARRDWPLTPLMNRVTILNALSSMMPRGALKRYRTREGEWDIRAVSTNNFNQVVRTVIEYLRTHPSEDEAFRRTLPVMPKQSQVNAIASSGTKTFHCERHGDNATHPTSKCRGGAKTSGKTAEKGKSGTSTAKTKPSQGASGKKSEKGPKCGVCGHRTGHTDEDCFAKSWVCRGCNKVGHLQRVCPAGKSEGEKTSKPTTPPPKNGGAAGSKSQGS